MKNKSFIKKGIALVIPAFKRQKQACVSEFKASLGYLVNSRTARELHSETGSQKEQKALQGCEAAQ